jgi:hypothetical protein
MAYSALIKMCLKLWTYFLKNYVTDWRLEISITSLYVYITNAAAVHSSLQLSISAQALGMASPFKLPSQVENMLPCTFPQANLGKMTTRAVL